MFDNSTVEEKSSIVPAIEVKDCRLVKIEAAVTKTGEKSINFTFQEMGEGKGGVVTDRIFEPIDKTATPPYENYSFETERNKTLGRLKHIMGRYMSPEQVNAVKGATWDDYTKNVINAFPAGYKEIPCSLSVVYIWNKKENKDFVGLRLYPPFVSTAAYPKEFPAKLYDKESLTGHVGGTGATTDPTKTTSAPKSADEI